jgi:hypothetical protein
MNAFIPLVLIALSVFIAFHVGYEAGLREANSEWVSIVHAPGVCVTAVDNPTCFAQPLRR